MILPILINQLLGYFDGRSDIFDAIKYGLIISFAFSVNTVIHHPYFLEVSRIGMKIRIACFGLLYKKAFRLKSRGSGNEGQLINLIANDASRVESVTYFIPYLLVGPIQTIAIIILIVKLIDVSVLSGLLILVISIPSQAFLGKLNDKFRFLKQNYAFITILC